MPLFNPFFTAVDGNGVVMPGALLQFYTTGTTTPQDTFTTSALNVANANPVVADANGLFPSIYLTTAVDYKAVLKTSGGTTVATRDPLLSTKTITTRGDLIVGGVAGVDQRLALGTSGQILKSDGTDVTWGSLGAFTLADGTIATTQAAGDNSTKVATTAYVNAAVPAITTTYTPVDGSGAGLAFTGISGRYMRIGAMVHVWAQLTFPVTASGAGASIGLPVAVPNVDYAAVPGPLYITGGVPGTSAVIRAVKNTSAGQLRNSFVNSGAQLLNSDFSAATIAFSLSYPSV